MTATEKRQTTTRTFSITIDGKGRMTADLPTITTMAERGGVEVELTPEVVPNLICEFARVALQELSIEHEPTFVIVDDESDSYVQAAGCKERLTVEWREYSSKDSFEHYVAGLKQTPGAAVEVKTFYGHVDVFENECLKSSDAKAIFEAFVKSGKRPDTYEWRNSTANFQE